MQVPDFGEEAEDGVRWKIIENHSTLCPRIVPYLIAAIAVSNLPDSHPKFCRRFGYSAAEHIPKKTAFEVAWQATTTAGLGELEEVDMRGKRVIITGATSGLGQWQAEAASENVCVKVSFC